MSDLFVERVRCASRSAWWTVLIGAIWLTASWLIWLVILAAEPQWLLMLWGGHDLNWNQIHWIWLIFIAVAKLMLFACVLAAIYLTLWARRLERASGSE